MVYNVKRYDSICMFANIVKNYTIMMMTWI